MRVIAVAPLPTRERGRTEIPEGLSWEAPAIDRLEQIAEAMRLWLDDAEVHCAR
jgi:hypothetical protein